MYSFVPQILIIVSVVGIIVIVLRRTPGLILFVKRTPIPKIPIQGLSLLGRKLWGYFLSLASRLWALVLEVKELSKTKAIPRISKSFPKISFPPKVNLGNFRLPVALNLELRKAEKSLELGDYAGAEKRFIELIKKDSKNQAAYAGLGKLYFMQKKYEESAETYEFLVKRYPRDDRYFASLGQVYNAMKFFDKSVEAYETAISLAPENPDRYVNLGLVLEASNRLGEAILNYRKASDLDKKNVRFLMILAEALAKNQQKEDAETIFETVLQIDPTNQSAREKLMRLKF